MTLGFAMSGGVDLDARTCADIIVAAVDAGLEPAFATEVSGAAATVVLAAVAARRPGHVLGTGIVPLGSRSEAALAMEATSCAAISGSPFLLGVGVSSEPIVEGWHGATRDPSVETTRRALGRLRGLLDGERSGPFALRGAGHTQVRVLLGALGPRMVDLGCTVADGVILNLTPHDAIPGTREGDVYAYVWVRACPDADVWIRRDLTAYMMARPYAQHFTTLGYGAAVDQARRLRDAGRLREVPATIPDEMIDRLYVDQEELRSRAARFEAAGVRPVAIPVTGDDPAAEVRALFGHLDRDPTADGSAG